MRFGHPKSSRPKSGGGLLLGPPRRRGNQMWLKGLASENDTILGGQPFVAYWKKGDASEIFRQHQKKWFAKVMEADGSEFSFSIGWFLGSIFIFQGVTQNGSQYLGAFFRRINLGNAFQQPRLGLELLGSRACLHWHEARKILRIPLLGAR